MCGRLVLILTAIACLWPDSHSHAQIYRWDNGEVIPGTEQITPGPGVQLNNWNTATKNLRFAELTGNLTNANFAASWLDDTRFAGADLTSASLGSSTLTNANLAGVNLTNASLESSTLSSANLTGAVVKGASLWDTTSRGFTASQLYSTISCATKDLRRIVLGRNELTGWDFHDQNLAEANFSHSTLTGANLAGVDLNQAYLLSTQLGNVNLSGANLNGANLYQATFTNANLTGANLAQAFLSSSTFNGANLTGANLTSTYWGSTALNSVNMTGAMVALARFGDTTSRGFTAAQLYSTQSYAAKDLSGIGLGSNDLTGWDFHDQKLSNADFYRSTLTGANLSGANLTNANLRLSSLASANLSGADVTQASLGYSDLTDTNLAGAVVTGTDFSYTTSLGFTAAQLYSTQSYAAKDLHGIRLDFNDLTAWDFIGQNLTNAYMRSSTLTNANLTGAVVAGAQFGDTTSKGFTAAQLYSTHSYAAQDLRGIGLWNNDLTGWDFSGQNLTNAYLSSSMLTNANLAGADTRGAKELIVTGAILKNTILPDGQLNGLELPSGVMLVIRDEDGVPAPPTEWWLQPRPSIPVTIQRQLTMADGGVLKLLLEADPWDSKISFQPDIPLQLGGTLELTFTDDTQLATQSGRTIQAFDWTGVTPQGTFAVRGQPGTAWDASNLYTTGEVTMLGISSDLNADKDVDSDDLLNFLENWTGSEYPAADRTWQDGDSDDDGDVDSADMLVFLNQWTGAAAAETQSVASVPEPGCLGLAGVVGALVAGHSRRRRRSM